ncbi:MAG: hypothetical protein SFV17_20590 [Candidatus Obscuribacter sp.]|nr:hypothetical protein [Candidatus Obscuribacter sp.]
METLTNTSIWQSAWLMPIIYSLFIAGSFFLGIFLTALKHRPYFQANSNNYWLVIVAVLFAAGFISVTYFGSSPVWALLAFGIGAFVKFSEITTEAARRNFLKERAAAIERIKVVKEELQARTSDEEIVIFEISNWSGFQTSAVIQFALASGLTVVVESNYSDRTVHLKLSGALERDLELGS